MKRKIYENECEKENEIIQNSTVANFGVLFFFVLLINKNSSISFDVSSLFICCCYIGPEESDITCWVLEEIQKN